MIDVSLGLALRKDAPIRVPEEVQAACDSVAMQLFHRNPDGVPNPVGVTSALRREGRTTIAAGLAIAQATALGRRAVLLDLDVDSRLAARMDTRSIGQEPPVRIDALEQVTWVLPDLGVLSARAWVGPTSTVTRRLAKAIVEQLHGAELAVIADLPALPPEGSGDRFADLFSDRILVVRAGSTPLPTVRRAMRTLPGEPMVVLNAMKSSVPTWLGSDRER